MNLSVLKTNHMTNATSRAMLRRGFTLIELLVVIAVTAVLFALLLVPLISALRYTQQAQIVTAAQDAARITKERLTRELNSAAFVFDGTSHPFRVPAATTPTAGDDRYTNFLDLQILDKLGTPVVAHAYSAKLDFVQPKLNTGDATDPTTGEQIKYRQTNGSSVIGNPSYIFPLAAGTTMIRYWPGLRDPTKPYNNTREGHPINLANADKSSDNTYILYRAQFQPYKSKAGGGVVANADLFATRDKLNADGTPALDASGQPIQIPELDDPDFFRYVTTSDVNWLNDAHSTYTPAEVSTHNTRVDTWQKIAKSVIPGPNVDLLLLPHNTDNTLAYDSATGAFPGVAHSGVANDPVPVNGKKYPIVNTSVTFRPATVSGDATPGTTAEYNTQGAVSSDAITGFTYIPTVYTATSQSWALPYHVSVYPSNYDLNATNDSKFYYDTDLSAVTDTGNMPPLVVTGDVLEYRNDTKAGTRTLVYNVTQGFPVTSPTAGTYTVPPTVSYAVPMSINPDTGTINFAVPSFPKGYTDRFARQWFYAPAADGTVDLTQAGFTDAALTAASVTPPLGTIVNAHIVPGSVRVYGPDTRPGASQGSYVSYVEVNLNSASSIGTVGEDQFSLDYLTGKIQLYSDPTTGPVASVGVIYDYQANMTLTTPNTAFDSTTNTYQPMRVKVDYQTRDLIDAAIGVRIYDITNNKAQVIPTETKIKIGNSNR